MRSNRSFDSLLQPTASAQFFSEYWDRKPLLVKRSAPDYYRNLLSFDQIDRLFTTGHIDTASVRNADASLRISEFVRQDGSLDTVRACQLFADGATILIREADKHVEALATLCREIEVQTSAPCRANVYVTPPHGKGFDLHYDTHDVFLLQLEGSKEWTIYDPPVQLPLPGQPFSADAHTAAAGNPRMTFVLHAGDTLYLPRGYLHQGRSQEDVSIHATLGVLVYRWADVIMEAVARLCLADPAFRGALPTDLARPGFDLAAAQAKFADLAQRIAQHASPQGALEHFADQLVTARHAAIPGQLSQVIRARALTVGQRCGVRPHTLYTLRVVGETLHIRAQGRQIQVPVFVAAAVDFALTREAYSISDLPGELDDDSKLALVKCLVEEGLVRTLDGA
jgi:ribosomal protein L16 Arg81 hydroxylase